MTTPSALAPDPSPNLIPIPEHLATSLESSDLNTVEPKPFPHPSTFNFLPDLYSLISRLSVLQNTQPSTSNSNPLTSSPNLTREKASSISGPSDPLHKTPSKESNVEIKDLPSLLYGVRQAIQNARDVVSTLPDVDMSIAEQEEEIRSLEGRIKGLRGRLRELGHLASHGAAGGGEEDVMEGVEGRG